MTDSVEPTETKQYIGLYRILTPIGVGSSATVYRGVDEASETEVAVKVLADNYSLVPEIRQRFLDEIALLMSIRTPAVAQVFGHGETESGQPYIVLELADRGTLGQRVDQLRYSEASPNRQDLLATAEHLAEALAALHRAGIVHRDVSPGNILIREVSPDDASLPPLPSVQAGLVLSNDERYLLADLGFAKDLQHASGLTAGGGTRGFAAPEQRDEVTVVDHRADIFGATSVIEWMAEDSELIDEIEPFLQIGLADDPEDRYQSMEDWRKGLHHSLDRRPPVVPASSFAAASDKPKPGGTDGERARFTAVGGRARFAAAAVGAVLVAGAAVGFAVTRSNDSDDALGSSALEGDSSPDPESPTSSEDVADSDGGSDATSTATEDDGSETSVTTTAETAATTTGSAGTDGPAATGTPTTQGDTATTSQTSPATAQTTSPATETTDDDNAASTTVTTRPTTATTQPTTATTRPTTATTAVPTTATTVAATTTTVDPRFEFSPRAYVESPAAEATVTGDLRIRGTAEYRDGITGVALIVRRLSDDFVWAPSSQSFTSVWAQIPVAVTPSGANEVTWSYTVDESVLEPGRYLIRVWARGTDANDPLSDRREIVIPG